jgi:hypothetical protein
MNTYLTKSKVDCIRQCQQDFVEIYGRDIHPFTRKIFFYFYVEGGLKYVHKESLRFVYSNAETFTHERDPRTCELTRQYDPIDVISFLEDYSGDLLPQKTESNDKFLVYEYEKGDPITHITEQEFFALKHHHEQIPVTPFYNSMAYNLIRTDKCVKLIDLKHFEMKDDKPFFIYAFNEDINLNALYVEQGTPVDTILTHLNQDYPANMATITTYER